MPHCAASAATTTAATASAGDACSPPQPVFGSGGELLRTSLPGVRLLHRGKVRDIYELDQHRILVVTTDRVSAFDVIMLNGIPNKGKILHQISMFWFALLAKEGVANTHVITGELAEMPAFLQRFAAQLDGRTLLARRLAMMPVEAVVRGFLTGSAWRDYQRDHCVCGHQLPRGLVLCERLPQPIYTPSTKAEYGEHDENITRADAAELVGAANNARIEQLALACYAKASAYAESRGIIIADTKLEMGSDANGDVMLADEVLTPDSSRFWSREQYECGRAQRSYDKQLLRDWLDSIAFDRRTPVLVPTDVQHKMQHTYLHIFRVLCGHDPVLTPPKQEEQQEQRALH